MKHADLIFKALGDPLRVRIVEFLRHPDAQCCSFQDKVCACDVERLLGLSQPTISHHMKLLVQAGLVVAEKTGRWVYYRIDREAFAQAATYLAGFAGAGGAPPAAAGASPESPTILN